MGLTNFSGAQFTKEAKFERARFTERVDFFGVRFTTVAISKKLNLLKELISLEFDRIIEVMELQCQ